jgi:signal transduction histidine kinase
VRLRLNLVALAVTSMVALAFLFPLASLVDRLAEDRALTLAERDAQLVARFVAANSEPGGAATAFARVTSNGRLSGRDVSLIMEDGRVFGAPIPAGEEMPMAPAGAVPAADGRAVLVPAVGADGLQTVIRVLVTDAELNRGVTRSWMLLILLTVTLVMIAVAVTDRLARSIVGPVEERGDAAARLGKGDFSARVDPDGPQEVAATGVQFNRLASEIGRLIQSERETAADLSHRLRTPLMAARLRLDQIDDPAARADLTGDLDEIERSIDHAIEELRRPARSLGSQGTVFEDTVRARAEFWAPLAEDQDRKFEIAVPLTATIVPVPTADLTAAIDALLGNVFAHTREGTGYRVEAAVGDYAVLTVSDEGAGFSSDMATLRGQSTAGSTGLGLDIARKTAEAGAGSMTVGRSPSNGARIQLTFRPAPAS